MTEQEAEVFAERLTRIWLSQDSPVDSLSHQYNKGAFYFLATIRSDIHFRFILISTRENHAFLVSKEDTFLRFWYVEGMKMEIGFPKRYRADIPKELLIHLKDLSIQWLPFFRRNCWLSGLPIEATAHEKAEWMQGFSREELETWNLRF